jgi:tetratricopeptide (TPR) repeat protein
MSHPTLTAAIRLRELRQYDRAEAELRRFLAGDPDSDTAHHQLAICLLQDGRRQPEALEEIRAAIGLAPRDPAHHAMHAFVLFRMDRWKEALAAAGEAIREDPASLPGWLEKARAHFALRQFDEAEAAIRQALALDPDDENSLIILSAIQQQSGNVDSGLATAEKLLARDADSSWGHANLGWAKLRQQKHREAEAHFREALRLEPGMEFARSGLIESFKARSPLFRLYLQWVFWLGKFGGGQQLLIIIGFYVLYQIGRSAAASIHPLLAGAIVLVWIIFAFGSHLANGLGRAKFTC